MYPALYRFMTIHELKESLPFTDEERIELDDLQAQKTAISAELTWWHRRDKWVLTRDDLALYYSAINAQNEVQWSIRKLVATAYLRQREAENGGQK